MMRVALVDALGTVQNVIIVEDGDEDYRPSEGFNMTPSETAGKGWSEDQNGNLIPPPEGGGGAEGGGGG